MSGITHLIWDWNGTLLDDVELCCATVSGMLVKRGLSPLSLELYREVMGFPVVEYYLRVGFDLKKEPFAILADEYMDAYRSGWRDCRLHKDALTALTDHRWNHSMLSASWVEDLMPQLDYFGVKDLACPITGTSDHLAHGKLEQGRLHIDKLGVPMDRLAMIGDTLHDAQIARELGCACFLLSHGHQSTTRLQSAQVPIFDSISSLLSHIAH